MFQHDHPLPLSIFTGIRIIILGADDADVVAASAAAGVSTIKNATFCIRLGCTIILVNAMAIFDKRMTPRFVSGSQDRL